jgi:hypothetical protein
MKTGLVTLVTPWHERAFPHLPIVESKSSQLPKKGLILERTRFTFLLLVTGTPRKQVDPPPAATPIRASAIPQSAESFISP